MRWPWLFESENLDDAASAINDYCSLKLEAGVRKIGTIQKKLV